jgi:hypothetical protein
VLQSGFILFSNWQKVGGFSIHLSGNICNGYGVEGGGGGIIAFLYPAVLGVKTALL